jgi:hypothetical protein
MQSESTWLLQRGVIRKSLGYHWVILLRGNQGETKVGKVDRAKAIDGTKQIDQRLFSISETQQTWHTNTQLPQRPGPSAHSQGTSLESSSLDTQTLARPLSYIEWLILRRVPLFSREIRRCAINLLNPTTLTSPQVQLSPSLNVGDTLTSLQPFLILELAWRAQYQ